MSPPSEDEGVDDDGLVDTGRLLGFLDGDSQEEEEEPSGGSSASPATQAPTPPLPHGRPGDDHLLPGGGTSGPTCGLDLVRKLALTSSPSQHPDLRSRCCDHNSWDNVRVCKKIMTLRCRVCQKQWRMPVEDVWEMKCDLFGPGRCSEGDDCPKMHIHYRKQNLEERVRTHGEEVLQHVRGRGGSSRPRGVGKTPPISFFASAARDADPFRSVRSMTSPTVPSPAPPMPPPFSLRPPVATTAQPPVARNQTHQTHLATHDDVFTIFLPGQGPSRAAGW